MRLFGVGSIQGREAIIIKAALSSVESRKRRLRLCAGAKCAVCYVCWCIVYAQGVTNTGQGWIDNWDSKLVSIALRRKGSAFRGNVWPGQVTSTGCQGE